MTLSEDSIVAIATGLSAAGIGILRVSGPASRMIATRMLGRAPKRRYAHYITWRDDQGEVIDQGLLLYFQRPHSFTGEDVLEFQGHGSIPVLQRGLQQLCSYGARKAEPGEFSQRAFLNGRIDLTQAEAVADLIGAQSDAVARAAMRSLQGAFAQRVATLQQALIALRVHVEAAIDFPEEEIDFLADQSIAAQLHTLQIEHRALQHDARQGCRLRDGLKVVLLGAPNAGKSSLLNALTGMDRAIVTAQPGTTRDVVEEQLQLDGVSLLLADTAGVRDSDDAIEREGIRRTREALQQADLVIAVIDASAADVMAQKTALQAELPRDKQTLWVVNKVDLQPETNLPKPDFLHLSEKLGSGLDDLRQQLRAVASGGTAGAAFSARQRHLDALESVERHLHCAEQHLTDRFGELLAEELRLAQAVLSEITGEFHSDDLLGAIFSSFCIGK